MMYNDVKISLDKPANFGPSKKTIIILYALPNGNSTEQTMGKKMQTGDDWHFDIQHIKAQTLFIRQELKKRNVIVAYLENNFKSWPLWKTKHPDYKTETTRIVDTINFLISARHKSIYLSGHSGGGRFIFSYMDAVNKLPKLVQNISFLDSDYGYDSSYLVKLVSWLNTNKKAKLTVFAYNDSIALLNGKRFVSDTGGTWYRSHVMMQHLSKYFQFRKTEDDSLINYSSVNKQIHFYFKTNPERKILHTQQVELNGFIHAILVGTKYESKKYYYFDKRAYNEFIE